MTDIDRCLFDGQITAKVRVTHFHSVLHCQPCPANLRAPAEKPKKQTKRASSTNSRSTSASYNSGNSSAKTSQQKAQHRSNQAHRGAGGSAAAAGWQDLLPYESLGQAALLRQQAAAAAAWVAELGGPSMWTSYTPVHLLPMMGCTVRKTLHSCHCTTCHPCCCSSFL